MRMEELTGLGYEESSNVLIKEDTFIPESFVLVYVPGALFIVNIAGD